MNSRAKGRRAELEYAEILENQGYVVEIVKGSSKFNKQVDFFGIADIIAINTYEIKLVQVKSNKSRGAIKQMQLWYNENLIYLPNFLSLEVAIRIDGAGQKPPKWRIRKVV